MALRILVNGWFAGQLATGSGQYLAGLQAWLPPAAQHEYILVLPALAGALPDDGTPPGWTVLRAATPFDRLSLNLAKLWFEQVTFPRACRRLGANVAFVPYWGSPWWQPCPVVVTIHDLIPLLLPLYRGGLRQRAYAWLVAHTARRAAAVLTDSAASGRDIVARLGIPAGKVHAIHLAVDPRFTPVRDPVELARVAARYGLPPAPFWLYLGGFDARKNLPRVIEAYARLARRAPDLAGNGASVLPRLVIAGRLPSVDTTFTPDPRTLAARLGLAASVHFTGWVDETDKPALYSLASAALFISEYEGFGLPVLEAQACGCPVITSQC
jgi:glycosyltransferase involved in cell wall biosynthesis